MRYLIVASLLALVLTACQPTPPAPPAQEVDLAPVLAAINVLDARIDVLADRVVSVDERLWDRLQVLIGAASDLNALVQQPLSVNSLDLGNIEGLIVTSTPEVIDFLLIAPGACDEDLPGSREKTRGGELLVGSFWPAPTGLHCISSPGGENHEAFGVPVNVPAGTIGSVVLLPPE